MIQNRRQVRMDIVNELKELVQPLWGAEQWILEGWSKIDSDEKKLIKDRMTILFENGLPFEMRADKLLYIYTFSLLAQLEVLAIQVPLKFESKMSTPEYRARMRSQLLDELFHGLVFTKIVYLLCAPHAVPPPYSPNIEMICNFIRNETCPKVAIMLLNLIGEGWIEEIFYSLDKAGIAPKVFKTILEDEHRHVCEADLYRDIGMPSLEEIQPKIAYLEEQLLTNIFMQYKYMFSVSALLGVDGTVDFKQNLDRKHRRQLKKINLEPSENWQFFMRFGSDLMPKLQGFVDAHHMVPMTPIRKVLMTQWDNPSDPTMAGQFSINVSGLDFFNKKFPPETLTTLMMQTVSLKLSKSEYFRYYLSFKSIFMCEKSYVALVVKLPGCADQMATAVFENCHEMSFAYLSARIQSVVKIMTYCYKRREALENKYPQLLTIMDSMMYDFAFDTYGYPMPGLPFVSLSNIGNCGYTQCKSPLRRNESMKYTLMAIEKKPVWNMNSQSFEAQDMLPVSISADHRIFDGNTPVPKLVGQCFDEVFAKMLSDDQTLNVSSSTPNSKIETLIDKLLAKNVEMGYKALLTLQTYWFDFLSVEEYLNVETAEEILSTVKPMSEGSLA